MAFESKFAAASKAAGTWLNTVGLIAKFGRTGAVDPSYELLMPSEGRAGPDLLSSFAEYGPTIRSMLTPLRSVSDGQVRWEHGRGLSGIVVDPKNVFPH